MLGILYILCYNDPIPPRKGGDSMLKEEKKVEYLELIYDLIFVYVIGRNSSLLRNVVDGFVPAGTFLAYILYSLAVIQI